MTVKGSINPNRIYRLTKETTGNEKVARREQRVMAQIGGADQRIWVLSDTFRDGGPHEQQWLGKVDFAGVLATYEQAMNALPAGFPRRISSSAPSRPDALVIYDGSDAHSDEKTRQHFSSHYWVPVTGSGNSIFVWVAQGTENDFGGSISGVLEPRERSDYKTSNKGYAQFSVVTGETLPSRYGVIQYRTANEYNDAVISVGWPILLFGWMIAGAGLFGLILYVMAPRIILDAWKKAFESVREQWKR